MLPPLIISNWILFTFVVPPHQILVYDASGRDVAGAVGPLQEGDNLVLTCEVRGGKALNILSTNRYPLLKLFEMLI